MKRKCEACERWRDLNRYRLCKECAKAAIGAWSELQAGGEGEGGRVYVESARVKYLSDADNVEGLYGEGLKGAE